MKKIFVLLCGISLVLGLLGIAGAATISVAPENSIQSLNSIFDLSIVGTEFTDGDGGSAGGALAVSWDPAVLFLNTVDLSFPGDQDFGAPADIDNSTGMLSFSVTSFGITVADPAFEIAMLNFSAIGLGLSGIDIIVGPGGDVWTDQFNGAVPTPTAIAGSVNVVPIPGPVLLLGTGLIGLVGIGRKRRS